MKHTFIFTLIAMLALMGCKEKNQHVDEEIDDTPNRTVLVYIMGENSLGGSSSFSYSQSDFNEMLSNLGAIPKNSRLIVYMDDSSLPRVYELNNKESKVVRSYTADHDSTDPEIFREILQYTLSTYRADSYGLVMWSHGSGWIPGTDRSSRSIGVDNGNNSMSNVGNEMDIADMARILADFPPMDFILFDACFMQCVEVAYELKEVAHYILGSPAEIPGYGAPYDKIMEGLFAQPNSPELICENYYQHYVDNQEGVVLSMIKCDELEELADITASALHYLAQEGSDISTTGIQQYSLFWPTSSGWHPEFFDMNHALHTHLPAEVYSTWRAQFDKVVPYRPATSYWHSDYARYGFSARILDESLYGGMSMHLPHSKYTSTGLNDSFRKSRWYEAAGWAATGW